MLWITNLITGLRSLLHKRRVESELDEELDGYLEAAVDHKQLLGMSPELARRTAIVELGGRNSVKHQVWSSRWESAFDNLFQDIRASARALLRSPVFTAVALLSVALGIGANTAIFTLIHQVLLSNLPVRAPEQLVTLGDATNSGIAGGIDLGQYGMFPWYFARQLEADPGPFLGIASYGSFAAKVSVRMAQTAGALSSRSALLASAGLVSGNYFSVLGAHPLLGRTIAPPDDATPGSGAVAVLSFHFWQRSFLSDPAILGKTISINGTPFEVIGVMPRGFDGLKQELEPADLWTPSTMQPVILQHDSMLTPGSGLYFMNVFARLSPQAAASKGALAQSQHWIDQQVRAGIRLNAGEAVSPARQQEIDSETVPLIPAMNGVSYLRTQYGDSLQILMAVVVLVLLIACANLANFLLARAATRQREIATRLALGSSRARIARQGLIETLLLSLAGGMLGLALAYGATRALIAFVSQGSINTTMSPTPNAPVLLFTLGISLITGILFGLAPAITGARTEAQGTLSAGHRTSQGSGGTSSRFWQRAFVVGQVTLSLLLLIGAGLFLRTLRNLQHQDFGFERTDLLLAEFNAQLAGYTPARTTELHQRMLDRLSAIPGVRSAALAGSLPINTGHWRSNISISGYTPAPKESMNSVLNRVSGGYFETMGISIIAGRPITPSDSINNLKVAVVNQTIAKHFFPKGDAVGHSVTIDIDSVKGPWQIVGIARDTKSGNPRDQAPVMMTYIPLAQIEPFAPTAAGPGAHAREENQDRFAYLILLRTSGDPAARIAGLRAAMAAVDPNLPLFNIHTIHQTVSRMMTDDELSSSLTCIFALVALMLAAIGLYGVMSYHVVQRTNEIGVRMALGAQTHNVLWMILREAFLLLALGVALGAPLSLLAARIVRQQLFGLKIDDPLTYALALTVIIAVTIASAWLPARRAAGVNPVDALRCE